MGVERCYLIKGENRRWGVIEGEALVVGLRADLKEEMEKRRRVHWEEAMTGMRFNQVESNLFHYNPSVPNV